MLSPDKEISNALKADNPEDLRKALPLVLASPRQSQLIQRILHQSATNGYVDCYKIIAPLVFTKIESLSSAMHIPQAIRSAIRGKHTAIAEDLLDGVLTLAVPDALRYITTCALHPAIEMGNTALVKRILGESILFPEVKKALVCAAANSQVDVAKVLLTDLLDETKAHPRALATLATSDKDKTEEQIERMINFSQAQALAAGLLGSIKVNAHEVTALLLWPYLGVLAKIRPDTHERFNKKDIFNQIPDEVYVNLGWDDCNKLLESGIPLFVEERILRCLELCVP
ncbi:uncharacterized protein BJX67DRAFT_383034 [Aspergillus lucknowensis]|uniref:DUF2336 domain-containing protein n=1 Tax=Aspergillus lucknowensis TaxID=176173 RepID=A0ABR4LL82_9EURO